VYCTFLGKILLKQLKDDILLVWVKIRLKIVKGLQGIVNFRQGLINT
jgi:hypothetical protein